MAISFVGNFLFFFLQQTSNGQLSPGSFEKHDVLLKLRFSIDYKNKHSKNYLITSSAEIKLDHHIFQYLLSIHMPTHLLKLEWYR